MTVTTPAATRPAAGPQHVQALRHVQSLRDALDGLERDGGLTTAQRWGTELAGRLVGGGRLLAAGNGGSAAQAQHLTAELVGRYQAERRPLSGIALHAETSALTALLNDYPPEQVFARQVHAHGRTGDVLVLMSTSGRSRNLLAAAAAARETGVLTWAVTGPAPNPLAACCDEVLSVDAPSTATVQEAHLLVVHVMCAALDAALGVTS